MSNHYPRSNWFALSLAVGVILTPIAQAAPPSGASAWSTVVNINDAAPPALDKLFNSFNQPSVNVQGQVIFRARSRGPNRVSGVFVRDMSRGDVPENVTLKVADLDTLVPPPNNLDAQFNEFPSIPRSAIASRLIATRGNHPPVWEYRLPDGSSSRIGTSGIYVDFNPLDRLGDLLTGASKLGALDDYLHFSVPEATPGTPFDVFPGAPAVTDSGYLVFKGNYTEGGKAKTGVFFRPMHGGSANRASNVMLIANSETTIPGLASGQQCATADRTFGSTAPPSAAENRAVFVGVDDEMQPSCGGIYLAGLKESVKLTTLVSLGAEVPGVTRARFNRFGEGLSYDGRFVGFWGTWGNLTRSLKLDCPSEGNADRIEYCQQIHPTGYVVQVPVHQGVFVYDTRKGKTYLVAQTESEFDDFLYWNFSGRVPGTGGGHKGHGDGGQDDGEAARWRSSAYAAVSSTGSAVRVAFKARTGEIVAQTYRNPTDGIYLAKLPGNSSVRTLLDTNMEGRQLDPDAPLLSKIDELGLERDGFRGKWLVVNAAMTEAGADGHADEGMAGIYITNLTR